MSECRRIYQWTLVHGAKRGQKNKPHVVMDKISDKEVLYGTKSQSVYGKWKNRRRKVVREQKAKPGRHLIFLYKKKCGNNCSIIWMIVFVNKLW